MDLNHYTSAGGLEGILKEEHIVLRATRFSHLNDSKEYTWIKEKIPNLKESISKELNIPYNRDLNVYPFVACFSELGDDHLMWNLYGDNGKGFMLSFDYEKLANYASNPYGDYSNPDHLQSIIYTDESNAKKDFIACLNEFHSKEEIVHSSDIDKACAFLKRDIWKHEKETRYMRPVTDLVMMSLKNSEPHEDYDGEDFTSIKFRVGPYGIVPYIDLLFPKDILKSITIGYGYKFQSQQEALNLLLKSRGYSDVEIIKSNIEP